VNLEQGREFLKNQGIFGIRFSVDTLQGSQDFPQVIIAQILTIRSRKRCRYPKGKEKPKNDASILRCFKIQWMSSIAVTGTNGRRSWI
jgi:hypothetical protein